MLSAPAFVCYLLVCIAFGVVSVAAFILGFKFGVSIMSATKTDAQIDAEPAGFIKYKPFYPGKETDKE